MEPSLGLILLLRWTIPCGCSRWAKLSFCHWSFSLRCTGLKGPLAILGSCIDIIVVLLSKSITYELIESSTLVVPMDFISLGLSPLLKLAILFASESTNSGAYLAR